MQKTITLTSDDVKLVLAALHTVAPTGGSSPAWRLLTKISAQTDIAFDTDEHLQLTMALANTVLSESEEAGEVTRITRQ